MIKLFEDAFVVAVSYDKNIDIKNPKGKFHVIKNGLTYWTADPFPIEIDGELFIFAEIWQYKYLRGCIGYTKLTNKGFTKWKPVISEPYHLSYPNLIKYQDKLYMCPESNEIGEIYLYECVKFPDKWEKKAILYRSGKFCDTTFYCDGDDIFGFTFQLAIEGEGELKIFKLEENKICFSNRKIEKIGRYSTRPGGKLYYDQYIEKWLRVIQIGEPTYGTGLMFAEFDLSWPDFEEKEVACIFPDSFSYDTPKRYSGTHTFNTTEHYTVIDLKWNRMNMIELFWKMIRKIKKIVKNRK